MHAADISEQKNSVLFTTKPTIPQATNASKIE